MGTAPAPWGDAQTSYGFLGWLSVALFRTIIFSTSLRLVGNQWGQELLHQGWGLSLLGPPQCLTVGPSIPPRIPLPARLFLGRWAGAQHHLALPVAGNLPAGEQSGKSLQAPGALLYISQKGGQALGGVILGAERVSEMASQRCWAQGRRWVHTAAVGRGCRVGAGVRWCSRRGGLVGSLCTNIGRGLGQQVSRGGGALPLSFLSPALEGTCGVMSIHP